MKISFSKTKEVPAPAEFHSSEAPLFHLVYEQKPEDYAVIRKEIIGQMSLLQRLGALYFPWIGALVLPLIILQIRRTGYAMPSWDELWPLLLMAGSLIYYLYSLKRIKSKYRQAVERYPYRAFVVYSYGCGILAADAQSNLVLPPVLLYRALWKDIVKSANTSEYAILINKKQMGVLVSNRILSCSCEVSQASRILDEMLSPAPSAAPPIAEPK